MAALRFRYRFLDPLHLSLRPCATPRARAKAMRTVKLEHNDDAVLDPADPMLVMRGSVLLDGHELGVWEQRRNGTWIAWLSASGKTIIAEDRNQLIEQLALVSL
jgi:hypothetical protein